MRKAKNAYSALVKYKLQRAMVSRNMNPMDISLTCGIKYESCLRYMSGEHTPNVRTAFKIADVLGIDAYYVWGVEP